MKLAEALNLRADLKIRTLELKDRLILNSKVQEGEEPSEDPKLLLKELNQNITEMERLIRCINYTNCNIYVDDVSITDMIAKRDMLALHISILREFIKEASEKIERYSNKEIKILSTVKVSEIQKEIDQKSKELRELDTKIQGLNWTSDLLHYDE